MNLLGKPRTFPARQSTGPQPVKKKLELPAAWSKQATVSPPATVKPRPAYVKGPVAPQPVDFARLSELCTKFRSSVPPGALFFNQAGRELALSPPQYEDLTLDVNMATLYSMTAIDQLVEACISLGAFMRRNNFDIERYRAGGVKVINRL